MDTTTETIEETQKRMLGPRPGRRFWLTLLAIAGIFLLYAFAVDVTEINLERPLDPGRQENLLRVLRLLADPDFVTVNEATGAIALSETTIITVERIIETIFMALVASTIGTILAMPISFLAARNLMENVTAPLAAVMAGVIGLPIGAFIGGEVTGLISRLAAQISENVLVGAAALLVTVLVIWVIVRIGPPLVTESRRPPLSQRVWFVGRIVLIILLLILAAALLAWVGLTAGAWLDANLGPFGFLGNFLLVISDFVRLLLPALMALLAALVAASYGSRLGQEAVLSMSGLPARLMTSVLSGVGTAVIIYGIGAALNWLYQFDNPENWTTIPALIGGAVGLAVGALLPPKRPFAIGFTIYNISRSILNILRSIEPLIMGIVFVVWVSLGPFAGIMALTLHSIAALGKLFSEQVEGIDDGPVEAITSTGANRLQTIVYAVIPQIVPPFTAFALYRWDINVRMSTIIGFVGGGGIGFVLSQNIQQLRYRQAAVMMIAIAIVVMTLDYVSSKIRSRII